MAEIAIPAVILGTMYILSNQEKEKPKPENFSNISAPAARKVSMGYIKKKGLPTAPPTNFPVQNYEDVGKNTATYPSPNAATDRYFHQDVYEKQVEDGNNPSNGMLFKSLTGNTVQKKDIKFNNMVPFFGAKITGRAFGSTNESILDHQVGLGSQTIRKKEQAPLFAPQKNLSFANGVPNHTDFIQSRMNVSRNISNVKPWQEIQVGPGLNKGYTNKGSDGFNAGMEARKQWLPKTVDQLRVATNPKVTFGLANHEGPANATIKARGFEGRVEKNRPDTFFVNDPDRWFTTTGQEKAQRSRAEEPMQPENRTFLNRDYFGAGNANQGGTSMGSVVEQTYNDPKRPQLDPYNKFLGPAHNMNYADGWKNLKQNYGRDGYVARANARTTTRQPTEMGIVGGWIKAIVAPVMDVLRPSRKENVVGNMRPTGNVGGMYGVEQATVWNPSDRPKTTIREQTETNKYETQPFYHHGGGYATEQHQPIENQRQSTNCQYYGDAGGGPGATKGPLYNAAYNAHLNPNKEKICKARMNHGCESLFNSNQNIKMSKIGSTRSAQGPINMPKEPVNSSTYGEMSGRNTRGATIESGRAQPDILNAFRSNPYTQPLNSVA